MSKQINPFLLLYIIQNIYEIEKKKNYLIPTFSKKKLKNLITWKDFTIFFIKVDNTYQYKAFMHYQFFTINYLQNIFKIHLKEKNINALNSLPPKITKHLMFKVRHLSFKQFGVKYFNEVAHLFVLNIWLKNSKNICKFMKKKLDSVHFKKHKGYFLFFFRILTKYIVPNFDILRVKGVKLIFKGKLAKGGNARKRTMFYKRGLYSLSNKLLSINMNKWDIWTKTGSVGCTMQIFYKKYDNLFKFLYNNLFTNAN